MLLTKGLKNQIVNPGNRYFQGIIVFNHIGKNHPDTQYIISEDQNPTEVKRVTSEKDLGVIFDEKLIFRDQISKKAAIANRNIGLIFRSLTYIDKVSF